ncbi:unnamed protein product [Arabis nemorensis]|uniref:Uncharacterized protein n=1 Tax=Arabis nemorensis TaxID=586526 RepID=A0A565BLN0_9BRAS|nr:unnamed protein product [Arabis nemorensis]
MKDELLDEIISILRNGRKFPSPSKNPKFNSGSPVVEKNKKVKTDKKAGETRQWEDSFDDYPGLASVL